METDINILKQHIVKVQEDSFPIKEEYKLLQTKKKYKIESFLFENSEQIQFIMSAV